MDNFLSEENLAAYGKKLQELSRKPYVPYSRFPVSAILVTKNNEYTGINIENRSFGLTICAERTAVFKAVENNDFDFRYLLIYSPKSPTPLPPCGACRQVVSEFSTTVTVILYSSDLRTKITSISELLPYDSLHDHDFS